MFEVKNIDGVNLEDNPVIAQMSKYNHEQLLFCNDNVNWIERRVSVPKVIGSSPFKRNLF